jgi:hypothetical protein
MIRKAIAAFVAFMLGVTFAAFSAGLHQRPQIESVRVEVSIFYPNAPRNISRRKRRINAFRQKAVNPLKKREIGDLHGAGSIR